MEGQINEFLLGALENVLGKAKKTSHSNYSFTCPWCHHRKPKLEIDLHTDEEGKNRWQCWVCQTKGTTIRSLVRQLNLSAVESENILQFVHKGHYEEKSNQDKVVRLPDEFKPLYLASAASYEANRAKDYLYSRGLTDEDFVRYSIGYCTKGKFRDRVIIPSYNSQNQLNFFVGRSYDSGSFYKYMNPDVPKKDVIFLENMINWNEPIIICEGPMDSLAIRRNAVALLGKTISTALMKKIIENPVPSIYIALDRDAKKAALNHCETFMNLGRKVYFIEPKDKDPSEEGFVNFTLQLQKANELTFTDLVKYKLEN